MSDLTSAAVLGFTLRQLRERRGISQDALARHADLNRSFLSDLERGKANPSLVSLEKLAFALDMKVTELLVAVEQAATRQPGSGGNQ